jgi:hypothetical protein
VYTAQQHNRVGMCLWETQEAFTAPHWYPSAIEQWRHAKVRHRDRRAPRGAPMFWDGGRYGHVAIYAGAGQVRSSDAAGPGRMGTVPIDWFTTRWGYRFVGWTEDIGGQLIDFQIKEEPHVITDKDIARIAEAAGRWTLNKLTWKINPQDKALPLRAHMSTMRRDLNTVKARLDKLEGKR